MFLSSKHCITHKIKKQFLIEMEFIKAYKTY